MLLLVCLLSLVTPVLANPGLPPRPGRNHQVYFEHTANELHVYRVFGAKDGPTLMIIGGIQGDEPGGFLSADLYADMMLARGNLIVVPRANFYSIILNQRGPDGDMNRQFGDPITAQRHREIVEVLKELIAESDLLLNLHDGSGFYRPQYETPQRNPMRFGQSLIADAATYKDPQGKILDLKGLAERVLVRVNAHIEDPHYHLLFNNHHTTEQTTRHVEQRRSATYFALTKCHIPAFGVETSKSLPSETMKVRHHNLVINAFMEEIGIVPENPGTYLDAPQLKYLVISLGGGLPVVVSNRDVLDVQPGQRVRVTHIESNYERGLTCDILGFGDLNDLRREVVINKDTTVVVRKDHQRIGSVRLRIRSPQDVPQEVGVKSGTTKPLFVMELDGQQHLVPSGERLGLVRGDVVKVLGLWDLGPREGISVNFKGFVPRGGSNQGEDRGYPIDTGRDLMARYSSCPDDAEPQTECYRVVANLKGRELGSVWVDVTPPRLDFLVLQNNTGPKLVYNNGETMPVSAGETWEVVRLGSNVGRQQKLKLFLRGDKTQLPLPDYRLDLGPAQLRRLLGPKQDTLLLVVQRDQQELGQIKLKLGGSR